MQLQYQFFYKTPVFFNGIPLMSDPSTIVQIKDDANYGKTFKEIYNFTDEDVVEFVARAKWVQIREYRNLELKESDWTQGADVPDNIKLPWATYRSTLRNIPDMFTDPDSVIFPTRPQI